MSPNESPQPRPSPGLVITGALNASRGGFAEERAASILSALTAAGYVFTDAAAIECAAKVLRQLRAQVAVLDEIIDEVGIDADLTHFSFAIVHADGRREPVTKILLSELRANAIAAIAAAEAPLSPPQPAAEGPAS